MKDKQNFSIEETISKITIFEQKKEEEVENYIKKHNDSIVEYEGALNKKLTETLTNFKNNLSKEKKEQLLKYKQQIDKEFTEKIKDIEEKTHKIKEKLNEICLEAKKWIFELWQ